MKPTPQEIQAEILVLKELKPRIAQFNVFGEDNHRTIDAQVRVLTLGLDEDDIEEQYGEEDDNIRHGALDAYMWMEGELEEGSLSEGWKPLAQ